MPTKWQASQSEAQLRSASSHPEAAISDVPATFLVFEPKLPKDKHLLNLVREIFVDVNHNAKVVDASRIILLDNREFTRKAARPCVLQSFDEQADPVAVEWMKMDEELPTTFLTGIPQELIDLNAGRQGADVIHAQFEKVSRYCSGIL